jgi:hypothetical protein
MKLLQASKPPLTDAYLKQVSREEILAFLAQNDPETLPLDDRFRILNILIAHVVEYSGALGHLYVDTAGSQWVEESHYKEEISAILVLQDSMKFSPALTQWFGEKRDEFIADLRTRNLFRLEALWPGMSPREKLDSLNRLNPIGLLFKTFSEHPLAFEDVNVQLTDDPAVALKYRYFFSSGLAGIKESGAGILLNENQLDAPLFELLSKLYHECVHCIIHQLGIASHRGILSAGHPLYEDGRVALSYTKVVNQGRGDIRTVYLNDPQETLTFGEEAAFAAGISVRPSLRQTWDMALRRGMNRLKIVKAKILPTAPDAPSMD